MTKPSGLHSHTQSLEMHTLYAEFDGQRPKRVIVKVLGVGASEG